MEIAEELLHKYSFISINFRSLCEEMNKLQNHDIEWYQLQFQLQQQQTMPKLLEKIKSEKKKKDERQLEVEEKAESEAERIVEQKLSHELGKLIDIEKPLNILQSDNKKDKVDSSMYFFCLIFYFNKE